MCHTTKQCDLTGLQCMFITAKLCSFAKLCTVSPVASYLQ